MEQGRRRCCALRKTAAALEIKLKDMIRAFYLAVLGSPQGVPLFDAITHLGRDILRERLRHAMELLGPASKKEARGLDGTVGEG